ncbi:MAG: 16S rRNA (cytosine(1402)-N(4))-methyltransferase RsmH [Acidobacteria bacterium]|nr:16S rRNA (cytosine(1402)-N(4))-methyltransferase RsmH [Acidobacteriota bacterium]
MKEKPTETLHKSVLLNETIELLRPRGTVIDATVGLGGHAEAILESNPSVHLVGLDQDAAAIALASQRLGRFGRMVTMVKANFADLKSVVKQSEVKEIKGIVADLGVSSLQLDEPKRGFSFRFDAPLDMRMDTESNRPTAADLLETLGESEIADIIYRFGEERFSRRIARRIVERRERGEPVNTTTELAMLVEKAVKRSPVDKIHPATRTFQALRIAVNGEVEILEGFIEDAVDILEVGGRLAVITFHSIEDRIVKQTLQRLSGKCFCPPRIPECRCGARKAIKVLTRRPVTPGEHELKINPRARSAKLRAAEKN